MIVQTQTEIIYFTIGQISRVLFNETIENTSFAENLTSLLIIQNDSC